MYNQLGALSPLDGRYANSVKDLNVFFSEAALMRYRVYVEVEYLIALSFEKKVQALYKNLERGTKFKRNKKNITLKL